jgi:fluoroquinolone resistance protein
MAGLIEDETFQDEDWYGEELVEREYAGCTFSRIDLTEAFTRGCVFTECGFANVRFNVSRHVDSAFLRCTFQRCNFFEAEFTGCKLVGSTFTQTEALRPVRVAGGDWSFVGLREADLRAVSISGVRMREADLTGADCSEAVLTEVDLSGAQLRDVKFDRTDLRGSDLTALDPARASLAGAIITADQAVVVAQSLGLEIR